MMIRKQDSTKPGRRKEQRASDSAEENGNHTEETQHGPFQTPPIIGVGQENRKTKPVTRENKNNKLVLFNSAVNCQYCVARVVDELYTCFKHRWNNTEGTEGKCHFFHYKSYMDWPGLEPGYPQ
jgi:hypothetical protein